MNLKGIKILLSAYKMLMFLCPFFKSRQDDSKQQAWEATLEIFKVLAASLSATDHSADESNLLVPRLFPL